jgi:hypothetical protein
MLLRMRTAHHILGEFQGAKGFSIRRANNRNELEYVIVVDGKLKDFEKQAPPRVLFGRRVATISRSYTANSGQSGPTSTSEPMRELRVGDYLRLSLARGTAREGRIGCFIKTDRAGELIALTAAHVLAGRSGDSVYARSPNSNKWALVGEVIDVPSPGEGEWFWDDIGAVKLLPTTDPRAKGLEVSQVADPLALIGGRVQRFGKNDEKVIGEVEGIAIDVEIALPNGQRRSLSEAVIISGIEGRSFSGSGESGSLVFTAEGAVLGMVVASDAEESLVVPIGPALSVFRAELARSSRHGIAVIPDVELERRTVRKHEPPVLISEPAEAWAGSLAYRARIAPSTWNANHALVWRSQNTLYSMLGGSLTLRELMTHAWFRERPLFRLPGLDLALRGLEMLSLQELERIAAFAHVQMLLNVERDEFFEIHIKSRLSPSTIKRAAEGSAMTFNSAFTIISNSIGTVESRGTSPSRVRELAEYLTLEPAIFRIRDLDTRTATLLIEELLDRRLIDREFGATWARVLEEMIGGKLVTYRTASLLQEVLRLVRPEIGPVEAADRDFLRRAEAIVNELEWLGGLDGFLQRFYG